MSFRRLILVVGGIAVAVAGFVWLRGRPGNYVNFPPAATGPWVALGDSLTEGYGAGPGFDYPALLSQRLGLPITNLGRSGDTTADGLARVEEVAALRPRVVLLCLGGNDGLRQLPRAALFANLAALIDRLQREGSFVVLLGIRSASLRDRNDDLFKALAKEKQVFLVPDLLDGILFHPAYMSDAIHPNEQGYQRIAERLETELRPLLPRL